MVRVCVALDLYKCPFPLTQESKNWAEYASQLCLSYLTPSMSSPRSVSPHLMGFTSLHHKVTALQIISDQLVGKGQALVVVFKHAHREPSAMCG